MLAIIGIVVVFVGVFGGYIAAGGKMAVIIKALPFEMAMIGGSALGAFLISNSMETVKHVGGAFGNIFKGAKWNKQDYIDLLCLLFSLIKLMKTKGLVAVEGHIEKPEDSEIFKNYPKIIGDHFAIDLICDSIRAMTMDLTDPIQMEDHIEKQLEKHHHEEHHAPHALQALADGLPALGIVAAVLGVIKTMGSISEPPEVLGKMIGGALVGTFLGVFLSYGFVAPFAGRAGEVVDENLQFYRTIRDALIAYLKGNAAQVAVEIARGSVPHHVLPTFQEVEEALENAPKVT